MVCKEDVLTWFKDLECYKRIDVMYELLNMCMPFEIRFLGSCVEEIGKHSYQELRGPAIIANDVEKLSKDTTLQLGLLEETTRHRVLIYISLLNARNCACANWYYKNIFRTDWVNEYLNKGKGKDDNTLGEFVLLFTLGVHHPAFSFEQKTFFSDILVTLLRIKEEKKRVTSKPSVYSYPPGFGYPTAQKLLQNSPECTVIPLKTTSPVGMGDTVPLQNPPPGLPVHPMGPPPTQLDFLQHSPRLWSRPAFAVATCTAPEVPPFPPSPASPLVSQTVSPPSSRASSPHRTFTIRPTVPPPVLAQLASIDALPPTGAPIPPPLPIEPLPNMSQPPPSLPHMSQEGKQNEEETNHIPDDKIRDPYHAAMFEIKPLNGMQPLSHVKYHDQFVLDHMKSLRLEGENSFHRTDDSSDCSSRNASPPDTPTPPSLVTANGPGRGENNKSRMNGIPPFGPHITSGLCDASQPPPPPFSNVTVPYSTTCYQPMNLTPLANRSMFPYSQPVRPPFNTQYPYEYPYIPILFSSIPPPTPSSARLLNCYNCGAIGHDATDCTGQTIEEITQKAYSLEYTSPLPEPDKTL